MPLLGDKVAIITGGGSGIGREIALCLAREGARVTIAGRSPNSLKKTLSELEGVGACAISAEADVSKQTDCKRMVERTVEAFGRIDVLVNNAGIAGPTKDTIDIELTEWQEVIDINLTGAWLAAREVLPHMARQGLGNIINISSLSGRRGITMRTPYVASKWAMVGLTQAWANEWGARGIRVNCVCPGPVENDRILRVIRASAAAQNLPEPIVRKEMEGLSAMRRMVSESEVAAVVLFLASDLSSAVTGQTINADAGIAMN
jgi:NAD(P)-dependent dehydrogenase (short-subunit alcohol dehydrogenase family)